MEKNSFLCITPSPFRLLVEFSLTVGKGERYPNVFPVSAASSTRSVPPSRYTLVQGCPVLMMLFLSKKLDRKRKHKKEASSEKLTRKGLFDKQWDKRHLGKKVLHRSHGLWLVACSSSIPMLPFPPHSLKDFSRG